MEQRILGRTGLKVSALGMGGIGFIRQFRSSELEAIQLIRQGVDRGINFIETARAYFESEETIGKALKGGRRNQCILASKSYLRTAKAMKQEVKRSLKALQTDHLEIYQLHHIQYQKELEAVLSPGGAYSALESLRKAGVIDFIGVSSHNPQVLKECLLTGLFDTAQFPLNPIEEEFYRLLSPLLKEQNIGSIVMKPLMGGRLKNVEAALKFAWSFPVSTVIPGVTGVKELEFNLKAAENFARLSPAEREALKAEAKNLPEDFCRRCGYCHSVCPQEIAISEVFRCEDYLIFNATFARSQYQRLSPPADLCEKCGKCEEICPYRLPIREKLQKAHQRLTGGKLEDLLVNLTRKVGIYAPARTLYFDLVKRLPER